MNDTEAIEDDEGNRIFKIQLPSGKKVEATVDPSLKMMDLLISIASNNKLNPTAYQIAQPSKLKGRPPLVYTPSQSAGDIEGSFIMLLPKKEREQFSIYKGKKSGVFEHTVRLTIHSSKNHKMIFRTNPDKTLGEVFPKICEERGVEESHYVMRVHKHKEDADPTQTIQSFGVLDFDLVEVENEGKKKVGLLGKLKKKRTEKSKPTTNGSHNNHRSPPENKVQKQNSDGTVHHKPDGGVPSKPDGVTSHKKRPAPLPPSVSTANIQPSDVQAQSNTLEKSKPKVSRVSTKKRRAPAAPVAVVPINIEESSEQKKETTGDKEGVVDNSQRVGGHDESDAPSQVGIDRGQSMEVVTDGAPPSPAVSHGSSQGLSTSDKDKSSVTGSVSEHDNQGSIPPAPSKPPRLNLYSDEEIDAEFKLEGKPVFVPPSPPLTPPSASVPTEDVRKLIAEGRLSIEEDYPDGDASTNPDSSSVHDDEQFSSEENLASSHQSLDDIDGEIEIILAKVDGPEVKVAKTDSVAPDEEPKVAEISLGDVNIGGNAGFMVGTLPAELPPPPYVEQVPPPPMPPSPPPIPPEEEYLTVEDDLPPPPDDIPPPPPGEDPPRRKVCKCIDPENGEDCDHYTPGAVIKEGENIEDCPFARNNGDNDGPPGGPPDEPPEGGESIVLSRGDQPILSEEKKGVTHISPPVEQKFDISSKSNILPKPKRFNLRKEYAHPLENRLSIPKLLDLELSQVGHEKINFESPQESTVAKMLDGYVKEVYENNFCDVQQITSRRLSGLRINKRSDGDKDGPRPPETLALKLSFDDDSNETTSYSATPQEEDVAHEMEDKSLQLAMAASRLAKEEQKKDERKSEEDALSQNVITPVKKEDGKTTYQMQTDPVPEEVQDLKTMYQKMQAQLGELQQAILSNQGAAQQQPAAVQLQQLQQLQQQMLLQQQLLLQQGMMMPPMMMQTSPPQMMVPMAPHPMMVTPGMQQPYMVPPQQPVVTMTSPVAVAQSTEQPLPSDAVAGVRGSPSSDTVEVKASNLDKGEKELPKRVGSPDIKEEIAKEEEKPTSTSVEPATKELSGGGGSDNVEKNGTKTEDSEDIDKSIPAKQTVSSRTESKDGSPSTRRKNVFADILKKKGKQSVKSNYVLSAQKEMLNRQRSESDTKVKSTTQAQLDDRPRSGSDGPSKEGIPMAESSVVGGAIKVNSNSEKKDDKALESTVMKDTKGVRQVEDTSVLSKGSGDIFNGGTPETEGELPRIEGEIPKTEGEIPKEVTNNVLAKTEESSMVASNVRVGKSLTEDGKPNAKGDNSMAVTEFEAEFAVDTKSKVLSPGVEDDRTISKSLNNGSVPVEDTSSTSELLPKVPPKVAPKPTSKPPSRPPPPRQDGPRPFRRGTRPVSLASDRQNELQEMAGLSNVSRFKEMMAANLKSKESTN